MSWAVWFWQTRLPNIITHTHTSHPTRASPPSPALPSPPLPSPPSPRRSAVAAAHEAVFRADRTHNLVVRLRHNVIRAGLRRISLAYFRISLADVAAKLGLASVTDTESIVAKAIRWVGRWGGGAGGGLAHHGRG